MTYDLLKIYGWREVNKGLRVSVNEMKDFFSNNN